MKFLALVCFGALIETATAQTNQVVAPAAIPPAAVKPTANLVTRSGAVYKNFHVEKVGTTGLTISYTPDDGGVGISQIPFDNLSDKIQQRYGYDPRTAPSSEPAPRPVPRVAAPAQAPVLPAGASGS
jgi:hypothetical protein